MQEPWKRYWINHKRVLIIYLLNFRLVYKHICRTATKGELLLNTFLHELLKDLMRVKFENIY